MDGQKNMFFLYYIDLKKNVKNNKFAKRVLTKAKGIVRVRENGLVGHLKHNFFLRNRFKKTMW